MDQPVGHQPAPAQPATAQPASQLLIVPKYTAEREPGMEHIPKHPRGFIIVRIIQLVFALICIGLSGYILSVGSFGPAGFMIFVGVVTLIMSIYNIVALTKAHKAYNYWAVLAFEIFLWIFWLVAFAWMAAWAAIYLGYWATYGYYYDSYYGDGYGDIFKTLGSVMGGAAGIGALTWILYFITLIMHSVFMTRHRAVGLGNRPGAVQTTAVGGADAGAPVAGVVPGAGEKVEMQPQQPGQVYPQNTGFSQQSTMYNAAPPQQQQQQQQPGFYPTQQYQQYQQPQQQQQQYAPQQYPEHSGQQQPAYSVSAPSGDGSYQHGQQQMPAQTTGGSYVQGNPVAFPNSHSTDQLRQQSPPPQPQQGGPVHEAHGQSYDPHAPKEMQ